MKTLIAVVCIVITVSLAESLTPKEYILFRKKENEVPEAKIAIAMYVDGLIEGIRYTNGSFKLSYGTSLFCLPDQLILNRDNFIRMLDDALERKKGTEFFQKDQDQPVLGFFLLDELRRVFPCTKQ